MQTSLELNYVLGSCTKEVLVGVGYLVMKFRVPWESRTKIIGKIGAQKEVGPFNRVLIDVHL